ncbi:MAG: A/G-specific adenine glycosylase [Bdellovibrionales bacterium]|nr:A/G-specific adenine glycosylase [Bdellovibrionales bacterium]
MLEVQSKILSWYKKHRRDLPWRKSSDPYAIWLSEVMLQQTQVATAIPYYEKFLKTLPTIKDLSNAELETVLALWQGLGYYRRAKYLHSAAKEVAEKYEGKLPGSSAKLRALKGFGPYTAASVASIAFGEPVACVDGNVNRVISRIFMVNSNIETLAQELLDAKDPSSFNQAMMELGALVCKPKNPLCDECPVQNHCKAYGENRIGDYPKILKKKKPTRIYTYTMIPQYKQTFFLEKRTSKSTYEGFWQFPTLEYKTNPTGAALKKAFSSQYGLNILLNDFSKTRFKHQLTHQTIHVNAGIKQLQNNLSIESTHGRWLSRKEMHNKPLSALQKKIIQNLYLY